jgi:acyl-CoA hydrolase
MKKVSDSFASATHMVMPNDTNPLGNLMGGQLMLWMDIISAISAQKHCWNIVVTVSVDNVSFSHPIKLGDIVTLNAKVTRTFNTSMEVFIEVWVENYKTQTKIKSNTAFYTFVAVDSNNKPLRVTEAMPETDEEQGLYVGAIQRRNLRLMLANRLNEQDKKALLTELLNSK